MADRSAVVCLEEADAIALSQAGLQHQRFAQRVGTGDQEFIAPVQPFKEGQGRH